MNRDWTDLAFCLRVFQLRFSLFLRVREVGNVIRCRLFYRREIVSSLLSSSPSFISLPFPSPIPFNGLKGCMGFPSLLLLSKSVKYLWILTVVSNGKLWFRERITWLRVEEVLYISINHLLQLYNCVRIGERKRGGSNSYTGSD